MFAAILALTGCSDPEGGGETPHADAAANKWIYENMERVYLYKHIYPVANLNYNQPCESFFTSILSSDTRNDNDGKVKNGKHVFYSYMERTGASKTMAAVGSNSYGFEYLAYDIKSMNLNHGGSIVEALARVLYVMPDSPASKAGLKRGDWIYSYNGTPLTLNNYSDIATGAAVKFAIWESSMVGNSVYFTPKWDVNVTAAASIGTNPVYIDTVYTSVAPGNIGYLVYNSFSTSPDGGGFNSNGIYVTALKEAFARFKSKGIDHLVVDLRYNPGGYIECCRLLGSLIIDQRYLGETFVTLKYNGYNSNATYKFYKAGDVPQNVDMSKIYVLTTSWTASASELLINTLRPYGIEVVIIGNTTEGKNVGSTEYNSSKHGVKINPIVCQLYNKDDKSDYKTGFAPQYTRDEFHNFNQLLPLGDIAEPLLKTAIDLINGIAVSASTEPGTKSDAGIKPLTPSFTGRSVQGAIITEPVIPESRCRL